MYDANACCIQNVPLFPYFSVRKNPQTKKIQITSSVFKVMAYVSPEWGS